MTESEFRQWLSHHTAAFPAIRSWLAKLPAGERDGLAGQAEVLRAWDRILRDVPYEDAIAATDALARGDEEEPRAYDRHPAAVRAIARRLAAQRGRGRPGPAILDGQETYACLVCRDSGLVTIYHARTLALARRGELTPGRVYTAAAACQCNAGRRHAHWLVTYDPCRHLAVPIPEPGGEEAIAVIGAWLAERASGQPWQP